MAAKSIIDVEINDDAWKTFNKQVEAHKKTVSQLPGQWGAIGKAISQTQGAAAKLVAKFQAQAKAFKDANTFAGKFALVLKASDRTATSLAKNTFSVAKNLKNATTSLLKWGSIMGVFSGLLGAGGLFGIMRMAGNVAAGSSKAMGSGSTYGGTKAAGISYGQALGGEENVQSLMNRIAQEQQSGGMMFKRLAGFGMKEESWKNKAPSDVIGPLLKAIQQAYKQAPEGAKSLAMGKLAPDLDFNTILRVSKMNIDSQEKQYEAGKKSLELSSGTQSAYVRFTQIIDMAGEKLQNLFAKGLTPLLPALEKFSSGLIKAVNVIFKSPLIKNLVSGAGTGIESAAKYLTSEEFSSDLRSFLDELQKIGKAIADTASFLERIFGEDKSPKTIPDLYKANLPTWLEANKEKTLKSPEEWRAFQGWTMAGAKKNDIHLYVSTEAGLNAVVNAHNVVTGTAQ